MNKSMLVCLFILVLGASLTSCSTFTGNKPEVQKPQTIGQDATPGLPSAESMGSAALAGKYEQSMDGLDKTKLSRALDAGIDKQTHWQNVSTGLTYTVVPIRKVHIDGNAFCREYSITVARQTQANTVTGTACVASDGAWHIAG